ncbi:DUF4400 domain-containing protein [Herbaspirillum sp. ST 5-3]|uniref:DUF4400 domain-containing protein n=1 Tax=Oxalobacteraceae TaxID=75682 RepID=UPI0020001D0B|nr:DUF4400 domain-containing protein [Herbaspirillum sp. ST 5-3]
MIIRVVSAVSLVLVLIAVLYLPAAHPPQRFLSQLRIEHELNADFWGGEYALRILARMLDLHEERQQASPLPRTFTETPTPGQVDVAVAAQMAQMTSRLTGNPYFRSLDALLALTTYRYSVFAQWLPYLLVFVLAAVFDGAMWRLVKGKEFLQHSPEMYALYASMAIMVACGTVVAFVIPVTLHPVFLVTVPIWIGIFAGLALANFHIRG